MRAIANPLGHAVDQCPCAACGFANDFDTKRTALAAALAKEA